MDKKV